MPDAQGQVISWQVMSHVHTERSNDWFWGLGVIAAVGAVLAIMFGNVLFALIIVLGAGSLGVMVARGPREHSVRIDSRGISIDGTLRPYRSIKSFYVLHGEHLQEGREPRLYFMTEGMLSPRIGLPLENEAQAQMVKAMLKKFIPEEHQEPHLGEHLTEMLGL